MAKVPRKKSAGKSTSLTEYERKRDLEQTPEPAGDRQIKSQRRKGKAPKKPLFCVQKHLASHLHYDFRLEHPGRGVLLSWAVPKGPSLDPKAKRLAMHVEDHPLDYAEFEGVIPSGYGAGIVMLWDLGTWTPTPPPEDELEDLDAALEKGELKFRLEGTKLKGSWVLVRTRGGYGRRGKKDADEGEDQGPSRSWLLIKHRDEWSGAVDVTELAPLSVKSGGDFADILAAEDPDIWQSHRPAEGGAAGKMFDRIIRQAAEMKIKHRAAAPAKAKSRPSRRTRS